MWNNRFTHVVAKKSNRGHLVFSFSLFVNNKHTLPCCQFIDTKPTASVLLILSFSIYWLRCCHSLFDSLYCVHYKVDVVSIRALASEIQGSVYICIASTAKCLITKQYTVFRSTVTVRSNVYEQPERGAPRTGSTLRIGLILILLVNERSHLAGSIAPWCHRVVVFKPWHARPSEVTHKVIFIGKKTLPINHLR